MSETRNPNMAGADGNLLPTRGVLSRLLVLAVAILLAGQIVVAWFAVTGFERVLEPQLEQKADVVGRAVSDQIAYAIDDLRIPPGELVGVDAFLDEVLGANADIRYLILRRPGGDILFARGPDPDELARVIAELPVLVEEPGMRTTIDDFVDGAFPIVVEGRTETILHVGVSGDYVRGRLSEVLFDVGTVILVSLLVAIEFLLFFVTVRVAAPLDRIETVLRRATRGGFADRLVLRSRDEIGRLANAANRALRSLRQRYDDFRFEAREIKEAQIDADVSAKVQGVVDRVESQFDFKKGEDVMMRSAMRIRIPLFLFMFSEELSRSFLPLFIERLSPPSATLSTELLIGLPITLFMLAAAAMTPIGGAMADRYGAARVFLMGVAPAVIGYIGTVFAQGYYDLIAWRALSAVGYGLIFIAAQAWVAENTDEKNRAQGMAVFVGAVFAATICGPSIGGIAANRIGYEMTFLISAGLALISGMIVYGMLADSKPRAGAAAPMTTRAAWTLMGRDPRLFAVTVFAAAPGKMMLSGFLFYLVPLYLAQLENSQSAIGRMMMLYGVATIALTPLAARFADRTGRHASVVGVGGLIAGLGCIFGAVAVSGSASVDAATTGVVAAIIALGVGHALCFTSQLALVQRAAAARGEEIGQASVIGAYRLIERLGTVLGPIIAGGFATALGYQNAMIGVGAVGVACIIAFMLVYRSAGRSRAPAPAGVS